MAEKNIRRNTFFVWKENWESMFAETSKSSREPRSTSRTRRASLVMTGELLPIINITTAIPNNDCCNLLVMTARTNIMWPFSTWCWSPLRPILSLLMLTTTTSTITTINLPTALPTSPTPDQGCGLPLHAGHNDRGGSQRQRQPPRRAWKVQTNNLRWMIVKLTLSKMSLNKSNLRNW